MPTLRVFSALQASPCLLLSSAAQYQWTTANGWRSKRSSATCAAATSASISAVNRQSPINRQSSINRQSIINQRAACVFRAKKPDPLVDPLVDPL
eukprot:21299-Pyramimonas_sp.AAC.1